MIYLYVKIHNKTGLKYLGKTQKDDPHQYCGSGKYWLKHLNKHGYDYTTEIIFQTEDSEQFKEIALYYSKLWNIVENNEWANLMDETGTGGNNSKNIDYKKLVETRKNNGKTWKQSEISNQKRSLKHKGRKRDKSISDKMVKTKEDRGILHKSPWTKETHPHYAKKISESLKGVSKTKEHISNMKFHENNKPIHECPHCKKLGDIRNMKRWHFDNCKLIPK